MYLDFGEDFGVHLDATGYAVPEQKHRARGRYERNAALLRERGVEAGPFWGPGSAFGDLGDFGLDEMTLGLAVRAAEVPEDVRFLPGRRWVAVQHQSGGHACAQPRFIMSPLALRPEAAATARVLCDRWLESEAWAFGQVPGELDRYRDDVRSAFGLDVNQDWDVFEEAVYPIDCDVPAIRRIASDHFPGDLDELVRPLRSRPRDLPRRVTVIPSVRWRLIIFGPNCD